MEPFNQHWDINPFSRGLQEEITFDQIPEDVLQLVRREAAEEKKPEKIDISHDESATASNKTKTEPHEVKKEEREPEKIDLSHDESTSNKESKEKKQAESKPEKVDISSDKKPQEVKINPTPSPSPPPHAPPTRNFDFWESFVKPLESKSSGRPIQGASDIGVSAVVTSLGITLVLFLLIIGIYEICFRLLPSVYNTKKSTKREVELQQPVMIPRTCLPLGWIPSVLRVPWSQVRRIGGLENYLYLRYIRMCLQITTVSAFWGLVILFPIYATGGNNATGFYHVSASNLAQGSARLWAPTIFMWLLTLYVLYVMHEEYKHYVECRMEFLARDPLVHPKQRYTLMVEEIPHELRSDKALYDYFNALFPGKVHSASMVLRIPDLEALVAERNRVVRRLEKYRTIQDVTGKRLFHVVGRRSQISLHYHWLGTSRQPEAYDEDGSLPKAGEKVESVKYFTRYLAILNDRVARMQAEKQGLASKGDHSIRASQWISHALGLASDAAVTTLTGRPRGDDDLILDFGRGHGLVRALKSFFVDFFCSSFSSVHRQIDKMVESVSVAPISSTGFVTFEDLVTVTCAVRAPLSHEAGVLSVKMAPDPRDIRWESAHVHLSWIAGREGVTNTLLGLGAILWSFPVAAIQAWSSAKSLGQMPFFRWLNDALGENFSNFIIGYMPVIALLAIISLLPAFFRSLAINYEQRKTLSDVQQSVLTRFFYYQLANIFVTISAGSLLDSLSEIIAHPSATFAILAETVPTVVGYFVMLLLTLIFVALPIRLLRPTALINVIFSKLCCIEKYLTPRELDEMYSQSLDTGYEYPYHLLVVVIAFTYSVIAPVILPVAAVYFIGSFVVFKKQILFVYTTQYESGGKSFSAALTRTLVGLICGQVTLIGYTVLRAGLYQPIVLLPLPFYSAYMMYAFARLYDGPGSYLSLEKATALDRDKDVDVASRLNEEVYRQPALIESNVQPMMQRTDDEDSGKSSNSSGTQQSVKTV